MLLATVRILVCSLHDLIQNLPGADEDARNEAIVQTLRLLAILVKYGYYDDDVDVNALLPHLFNFLDGKRDFLTKEYLQGKKKGCSSSPKKDKCVEKQNKLFKKSGRYKKKPEFHNHFEIKHWLVDLCVYSS